jgi:tRNA nucleotidyltransferase (CCA-adding enzyme)
VLPDRQVRVLALLRHHAVPRALRAAAGDTPCHLVGGVLRDRLLGLAAVDFDAVVAGRGQEIAAEVGARLGARLVLLGGKAFAAYRLVSSQFTLDLWDRQQASLESDLGRRDFTVNSFALDLRDGELVDPFAGLRDLRERRLRATTAGSFSGDPLRVLRLPRLLLQLPGFAVEPSTLELAVRETSRLAAVAAERVREELHRTLSHPEAHRAGALLAALHVYPGLFLGSPGEPGGAGAAIVQLQALGRCILRLRAATSGLAADVAGGLDLEAVRFALLFANLPDRGDAGGPQTALRRFTRAGYLPRRIADQVATLLACADAPAGERAQRHFLYQSGDLWLSAAAYLGARAATTGGLAAWESWVVELAGLLRREGRALIDPPALVSGDEVRELLGVPPGPTVGRALAALRQAQVEGRVSSRDAALELLRSWRG